MTVYHGSFLEVTTPDVFHSRKVVDFGAGFYVTPIYKQAVSWSKRFKARRGRSVISVYELDEEVFTVYKTLKFDSYSEEWLDMIVNCRAGKPAEDTAATV